MDAINLILNLVGLLLWLNWRSSSFIPHSASALSLLSTLKRAEPRLRLGALYLVALLALIFLRSLFYWQIGPGLDWTPVFDLAAIVIPLRSDHFVLVLLFSFVSFAALLATFYAWLLLVSVLNRSEGESDPIQKLVRLNLGWIDRFPASLKLLFPIVLATLLWVSTNPLLVELGLIPPAESTAHLWEQAAVLGIASLLVWKFFFFGLLVLYVVNSYIYLGHFAFLDFVNMTARNLLRPFDTLPLRIGKIDLAPWLMILLIALFSAAFSRFLPVLYRQLPL